MTLSRRDIVLSHGPVTLHDKTAFTSKAVDGKSSIGHSGGAGFANCAINAFKGMDQTQFLRISLHHKQLVLFAQLHLRDGSHRYSWQRGLNVSVGNSALLRDARRQCGSPYQPHQGQSPSFICNTDGSYVWVTLISNEYLQVCEVEVYAGKRNNFIISQCQLCTTAFLDN